MSEAHLDFQHSFRIQPNLSEIKLLRQWIDTLNDKLPHLNQISTTLKTVITEWVTNVIIHSQISPSAIFTQLHQTKHIMELCISDDGSTFDNYLNHKKNSLTIIHDDEITLRENGMGLTIITQLFPNWIYLPKTNLKTYNDLIIRVPFTTFEPKPLIALIDGNTSSTPALIQHLESKYTVKHFLNQHDFFKDQASETVNLIVCNSASLDINAIQFKNELNQIPQYAVLPFILISSDDDNKIEEQANELGIEDFIRAPFKKNVVTRVMNRVLHRNALIRSKYTDLFAKDIHATLHLQLPPVINGYKLALAHRHAGIGGGDFALHVNENNQHLIIVGDVMGHGISAKFLESAFVGYLKGVVASLGPKLGPSQILESLSNILMQDEELQSIIMTCIVLAIDADGSLEIANAAHPFPIIINQLGIDYLEVPGRLLAISPNTTYPSIKLTLQHDDKLVLYTDGLFEQGKDALTRHQNASAIKQLLADSCHMSIEQSLQEVMIKFDGQTCLNSRDDMTIVMIEP